MPGASRRHALPGPQPRQALCRHHQPQLRGRQGPAGEALRPAGPARARGGGRSTRGCALRGRGGDGGALRRGGELLPQVPSRQAAQRGRNGGKAAEDRGVEAAGGRQQHPDEPQGSAGLGAPGAGVAGEGHRHDARWQPHRLLRHGARHSDLPAGPLGGGQRPDLLRGLDGEEPPEPARGPLAARALWRGQQHAGHGRGLQLEGRQAQSRPPLRQRSGHLLEDPRHN
mmetsp:Transcript_99149/g.289332  ORF Transcript_99149/g.289332 Transcript_99149/m.289332 type:complete len:227 (+) Transcript_99149:569-1249(+)